jgi:hypothetical protein
MVDTMDPGLGESLQLSAVGRVGGIVTGGTGGFCRGIEAALVYEGIGELVEDTTLVLTLRSSIACNLEAAVSCSYRRSDMSSNAAKISDSDTPLPWSSERSF